jgi:integrase
MGRTELATTGRQPATLEDLFERFLAGLSEGSRPRYRLAFREFFGELGKRPGDVLPQDVAEYAQRLKARGLADATIAARLAMISGFYRWAQQQAGLPIANPVAPVKRPRVEPYGSPRVTWLSADEAARLLQAPDVSTLQGKRDRALVVLLMATGMRRAAVAGLRWGDFQPRNGGMAVTWALKGGGTITRELAPWCWAALKEWREASGLPAGPDDPVFVALHDRSRHLGHEPRGPLSAEAIRQVLRTLAKRAGIEPPSKVRPHTLRRTAAHLLRESGASLEEVRAFLAHSSLTTTQRYLRPAEDRGRLWAEAIISRLNGTAHD